MRESLTSLRSALQFDGVIHLRYCTFHSTLGCPDSAFIRKPWSDLECHSPTSSSNGRGSTGLALLTSGAEMLEGHFQCLGVAEACLRVPWGMVMMVGEWEGLCGRGRAAEKVKGKEVEEFQDSGRECRERSLRVSTLLEGRERGGGGGGRVW